MTDTIYQVTFPSRWMMARQDVTEGNEEQAKELAIRTFIEQASITIRETIEVHQLVGVPPERVNEEVS